MILINLKLKNELKSFVKENKTVQDILVFGSSVRGKSKPRDLDILIIFDSIVDKNSELKVREILKKYFENISILSKTSKTILESSFDARESVLFEAVSLISGKNLAEEYGFNSFGMFKYNFKGWDKLKKTKFYHALNGRGKNQGVLVNLGGIKLSDQIILIHLDKIELFREFLESWKLDYKYIPLLMPERLSRKKILES